MNLFKFNLSQGIIALLLLSSIGLFNSCSSKAYKAVNYDEMAEKSQMVAVMPYEIIFNGKAPKNMTEEEMIDQDNQEKLGFQQSLYKWVASRWRKNSLKLQNPSTTLSKLKSAGIDIYNIQDYTGEELAQAAEVDMVFVSTVVKHRYRGDLASMGIDVVQRTVRGVADVPVPHISSKTNDVFVTVSLVHSANSEAIWTHSRTGAANWNYPIPRAMDAVHRQIVRNLPRK